MADDVAETAPEVASGVAVERAGAVAWLTAAVVPVDVVVAAFAISAVSGTWKATTRADPAPVRASAMRGLAFLLRMAGNLLGTER